jgi:GrpB-like predicted nucleotidyltransferase (UPF0157 family)
MIDIASYDPNWPMAFSAERARIARALGPVAIRIDHNGSTAVPGLAAKPVIDIQVSVRSIRPIDSYSPGLVGLGYVHVPHEDDSFCPFFHRPETWPHTHHVHVVESGGAEEKRTLAFRDYLREHSQVACEYEILKRRLASQHGEATGSALQAYADGKTDFVIRITEHALTEGYPRGF